MSGKEQAPAIPAEIEAATIIDLAAITETQWKAGRRKFVELAKAFAGYRGQAAEVVADAAALAILQAMAHVAPLHGRRLGPVMSLSRDDTPAELMSLGIVAALIRTHRPMIEHLQIEALPDALGTAIENAVRRLNLGGYGTGYIFAPPDAGRTRNKILDLAAVALLVAARIDEIEGVTYRTENTRHGNRKNPRQ